jgi:hypothetical protein
LPVRVAEGAAVSGGGGGGGGSTPQFSYVNAAAEPYNGNIQAALNVAKHVYVPGPAVYTITAALVAKFDKQLVEFGQGVTLRASTGIHAVLSAIDLDGVRFLGQDTVVDLNNIAMIGVRNNGLTKTIKRPKIAGFHVHNHNAATGNFSAIESRISDRPQISDCFVENYGYTGAGSSAYAYGLFDTFRARVKGCDTKHCKIGYELWDNFDGRIYDFSIEDMFDNGFYFIQSSAGQGGRMKLQLGTIDNCEEGIVFEHDNITVDGVDVINCRNKGMTLRGMIGAKVLGCRFRGNFCHVGDDNTTPNENYEFTHCSFDDGSSAAAVYMQLRRFRAGQISHCYFRTTMHTSTLISISGASDGSGQQNTIVHNTFNDVNKTIASNQGLVRINLDNGYASDNRLLENLVQSANVAFYLASSAGTAATGTAIRRTRYRNTTTQVVAGAGITYVHEQEP